MLRAKKKGEPSKRCKRKRKGHDDDDGLLELLGKLHAETNSRLETLSMRIGYEMDLGKARQNVFNQLGSMPSLSEELRYCEILGKDNSRLEIFMGLPEPSKPGYVMRILKKERLIRILVQVCFLVILVLWETRLLSFLTQGFLAKNY